MHTWNSRRSAILSSKAICASSQPLASSTGIQILEHGGNAADAAVAMAAVLNLTEPCSTGIGGDAFALYFDAKTKKVHCLQGNGQSPSALTLDYLNSIGIGLGEGLKTWDSRSGLCVTVPGAAALWEDMIVSHGKLSLSQVLAPAISLAENGFPLSPVTAEYWKDSFIQGEEASRIFKPKGQSVRPGQLFKNPDLANTFRSLAEHGAKKGFYSGPIAEAIVEAIREIGGVMTVEDLMNHSTQFEEPISTVYKGLRIYQTPPPSHGLCVLLALNFIQSCEKRFNLPQAATHCSPRDPFAFEPDWELRANPEITHMVVEAMRRSFADGLEFIGDPLSNSNHIPTDILLSEAYAEARSKEIVLDQATAVRAGDISFFQQGETVYFSVVDAEGNACSFINSNYMGFGTGMVPKGTGFTLQNRGFNFSLQPGHNNQVAPRKRPYHTIIPSLATYEEDGSLFGVFGNMGGFMQPMGHVQLIRNLIDHRLNPQEACDAPRWFIAGIGKTQSAHDLLHSELQLEDGYALEKDVGKAAASSNMLEELKRRGHKIGDYVVGSERIMYGKAQVILKDPVSGVLWAGSDPRSDGCAIPMI